MKFVRDCSTNPLTPLDWSAYFEIDVASPAATDIREQGRVTRNELAHYSDLFCGSQLLNKVNYDQDKEAQVRSVIMELLAVRSLPNVECDLSVNRCFTSHDHVYLPNPQWFGI